MARKKNIREIKAREVAEPQQSYGSSQKGKAIHFFSSFEVMEEDNYKWLASLTSEQHLQNATALIKRIFVKDLKKNPTLGTKLSID